MKKHQFSESERVAILIHHRSRCFWCGGPVRLRELSVDHVIPEHFQEKPEELRQLLKRFGLPRSFRINDYCNWVPSHDRCNKEKGGKPLGESPMTQRLLERLCEEAESVRAIEQKLISDRRADKILGRVTVALEKGDFSAAELEELLVATKDRARFEKARAEISAVLSDRWHIVALEENVATVTDGKRWGLTSIAPEAFVWWLCPSCKRPGPWSGVICLSCGQRSDPFD
jgi:hypothetical protein